MLSHKEKKTNPNINEITLINLMLTVNWIHEKNIFFFKEHELSYQQYLVLKTLKNFKKKPAALKDIHEKMISKMSNTTRLIDKLKAKGLVVRKHGKLNKRKTEIRATKRGLTLLAEIEGLLNIHAVEITKNLSIKEVLIINELLEELRKD
jgi:DNA-binding MarR family transcriptional regulator